MRPLPHRLRVAIVVASLRIIGGQSVQAKRLLNGWAGDGDLEAWIVPIDPIPPKPFDRLLRIKYVRTLVTQLCYWPLLFRELRRADVVHVFSASYSSFLLAPLPAVIVSRLLGKPVLLNYHSGEAADHLQRSWIARATLGRAVAVNVVPSPYLQHVFATFGIDATVVPNTVDRGEFRYRVRGLRNRPITLLSTRNFEANYNVACTLRAFAAVQARHPDVSLTLVGGGSHEPALRRLADNLKVRNVRFAGRVPPERIAAEYDAADIYVQTPAVDNMPLSVLEAFASGLPTVSTAVGGVPAILTDGVDGLLAPDNDADAVADRILRLIEAPEYAQQLAAAAATKVAQYDWTTARDSWLSIYRAVAKGEANAAGRGGARARMKRAAFNRLQRMSSAEVKWRAHEALHTVAERVRWRTGAARWDRKDLAAVLSRSALDSCHDDVRRGNWEGAENSLAAHIGARSARFILAPSFRDTVREQVLERWPAAARDAAAGADRIVQGSYDLLGYRGLHWTRDGAVDWHFDPVHHRGAPRVFYADVPFLSPDIGDHKVIWELNRHQHWMKLGRAAWLCGDDRYAQEMCAQLESWLAANPPFVGINWASMLEIGFRAISWTWALHCLLGLSDQNPKTQTPNPKTQTPRPKTQSPNPKAQIPRPRSQDSRAEHQEPCWLIDMLIGLHHQLTHVERHLSYYFSPNTHLTGEALALYVVGTALPELAASSRWVDTGRRVLLHEIDRQILADGGHVERSMHYQRYTLDFYLLATMTARLGGDEAVAGRFEEASRRLAEFTLAMADADGRLPLLGDDDGGMLWPLAGRACDDVRDSLAVAAVVLRNPDLAAWGVPEEAFWIAGPSAAAVHTTSVLPLRSGLLADTGYFVARTGDGGKAVLDAGVHGYQNGGHAHADALSLTLSLGGRRLLIDPGTATYTMDAALRDRMRSTVSHNTVTLDNRSHSIPEGPFHWQSTVNARVVACGHNGAFDVIQAAHDGYAAAPHRRTVVRAPGDGWLIVDVIAGTRRHSAAAHWHFDPAWQVTLTDGRLRATHADGQSVWMLCAGGDVTLQHGEPGGTGWCAPVYGQLVPTTTARIATAATAPFALVTWIGSADAFPSPVLRTTELRDAQDVTVIVEVTEGGKSTAFLVRDADPARPRQACRVGEYETDAAVFHYTTENGVLRTISMFDGQRARTDRPEWLSLSAEGPLRDLHVTAGDHEIDCTFSEAQASLTVHGASRCTSLRANGRGLPLSSKLTTDRLLIRGSDGPPLSSKNMVTAAPADCGAAFARH